LACGAGEQGREPLALVEACVLVASPLVLAVLTQARPNMPKPSPEEAKDQSELGTNSPMESRTCPRCGKRFSCPKDSDWLRVCGECILAAAHPLQRKLAEELAERHVEVKRLANGGGGFVLKKGKG
jgi:hypothetical protein